MGATVQRVELAPTAVMVVRVGMEVMSREVPRRC